MNLRCPNCKNVLASEHSFCPNCGFDLRNIESSNPSQQSMSNQASVPGTFEKVPAMKEAISHRSYWPTIVSAIIFSTISIVIWSYVYTGYSFDLNSFLSRLINHSFWLFIFPWIVSFFFKKQTRVGVFTKVVTIAIVLGIIFLFLGYSQFSYNKDPLTIRMRLLQPCIINVTEQMKEYEIPQGLKEKRSKVYCDCLINQMNDGDIIDIGNGSMEFWNVVTSKYKLESTSCVEESLKVVE